MSEPTSDHSVLDRINELSAREHELRQAEGTRKLTAAEQEELRAAEISLDQCWDLLRQRRARAEFGQDPADTAVRDADTVEKYRQ